MTKLSTYYLTKKYSKLFNSVEPYHYGISCADGWFNILDNLCFSISICTENETPKVQQIKEKLGTLRFYLTGIKSKKTSEKIQSLIFMAENLTTCTCEKCGAPGKHNTEFSHIQTLCSQCTKQKHTDARYFKKHRKYPSKVIEENHELDCTEKLKEILTQFNPPFYLKVLMDNGFEDFEIIDKEKCTARIKEYNNPSKYNNKIIQLKYFKNNYVEFFDGNVIEI